MAIIEVQDSVLARLAAQAECQGVTLNTYLEQLAGLRPTEKVSCRASVARNWSVYWMPNQTAIRYTRELIREPKSTLTMTDRYAH
jgi:hypothetical protein